MRPHPRTILLLAVLAAPGCATLPPPPPPAPPAVAAAPRPFGQVEIPESVEATPTEGPEASLPSVVPITIPEVPEIEEMTTCHARRRRGTEFIASEVGRRKGDIDACYERALRRSPGLTGRLDLFFTLGPNGRLQTVEVQGSTVKDQGVAECVIRSARNWRFPRSRSSLLCSFRYPLIFTASR